MFSIKSAATTVNSDTEYPLKADLRKDISKPLPNIAPGTIDPASMTGDAPTIQARAVVDAFNTALVSNDIETLASCFYPNQAYWRDIVALTSHLRTFEKPRVASAAFLEMIALRSLEGGLKVEGGAHFAVLSPTLMFITCGIFFQTNSPALECAGKLLLLPVKSEGVVAWKIWILLTWVEQLIHHPENEAKLVAPGRTLSGVDTVEVDVLIVGAGSSGLMTAARLKTLGVESILLDRNVKIGDSWANRYDSLRFHVPTSNCEMPYIYFRKELQSPHLLSKDEVAEHLQEYAKRFHLNVILETTIQSSIFSSSKKKWTVEIKTAGSGKTRTIVSKHLVQTTGLGSGRPYFPTMKDQHLYKGVSIHSASYRNAQALVAQGVKSIAVIGSANAAFDVMQDCYSAGLKTTMVARSKTPLFPYDHLMDPHGIGAYDVMPVDAADRLINTLPFGVDCQFSSALFAHLRSLQPDRYLALKQAGFPLLEAGDPSFNIQHNLLERGGGHYVDVGGTELIAEGKVAVRGLVEPTGYTESGLRLSDGTFLDADAVIWCTGFADKNVRETAREMLGTNPTYTDLAEGDFGPVEIAERLDATWGVDAEGEVRGVWKRHLQMENYWVNGGGIMHQRWWSRALAQQIKLALDGDLPSAYRDTPVL